MQIAVCVKQVPADGTIRMDEQKGILLRDTGGARINPYDKTALEIALQIKEQIGGGVTAVTMGPESARDVLKEAYAMGVDHGILVSDPVFAGADVFATSYTLAQALRVIGPFDCIICGRQTTDGDTAQTAPALAAQLGVPCLSWVSNLVAVREKGICVCQKLSEYKLIVEADFPCVVAVNRESAVARIPILRRKLQAVKQEFPTIGIRAMRDQKQAHYGLKGSPTQVKKLFSPEPIPKGTWMTGSIKEIAQQIRLEIEEH